MFQESLVIIIVEFIVVLVSCFLLARYGLKVREVIKKEQDVSDVVSSIIIPVEKKIDKYNERIIDLLFRVDLLESKQSIINSSKIRGNTRSSISHESNFSDVKLGDVTQTELVALTVLVDGPKTPKEIQRVTGKSREHVARIMKKVFEGGYVVRDASKKPYVYSLTDSGRSLVSEVKES